MPRYTIRIELLNAKREQYDAMYEHLDAVNIVDEFTDSEGVRYRLPPAEYTYDGPLERAEVIQLAKNAAAKVSKTSKDYRVLVTQSGGRTWYNLEKI